MSDDAELREELRAVVRRHDPDAETLRAISADLEQLADRFEATAEVV